jgi:predicted dehydrogenase
MVSIGMIGAGQFAGSFAKLFAIHPDVDRVLATDLLPSRAEELVEREHLDGTVESFEAMLETDVDAVAIFTQRWTHGPLVVKALRAGKHVYSAVPMAITEDEIAEIIETVEETGLTYMMGETSYYNPATIYARDRVADGSFGRIIYAEGDYVHDMDLGFYAAYQYSGGENWKSTASYPPMLYPTHAIGGVLGAIPGHAVSVSCIGIKDDRGDGVFDKQVSQFDNDFSNASALFELSTGAVMRTNEMRRVGYPSPIRESRFRYFGTEGSFEQLATVSVWQDKETVTDVSDLITTKPTLSPDDPSLANVDPALRDAFMSGSALVQDRSRLPKEYEGVASGHEGSHHFLADDFVRAVVDGTLPPVNAWVAARYTLPGIVAHKSALAGGERLSIPDHGDAPGAQAAPPSSDWRRGVGPHRASSPSVTRVCGRALSVGDGDRRGEVDVGRPARHTGAGEHDGAEHGAPERLGVARAPVGPVPAVVVDDPVEVALGLAEQERDELRGAGVRRRIARRPREGCDHQWRRRHEERRPGDDGLERGRRRRVASGDLQPGGVAEEQGERRVEQQPVLRAEVVGDLVREHPGALGDRSDRDVEGPRGVEQLCGGVHDARASRRATRRPGCHV